MSSDANAKIELPWTGERYVPEVEGEIELEHVHRYVIARDLAYGKDVLDIACGEGYGSELISTVARSVIGVDISEEAVAHASRKYVRSSLSFIVGSCASISLPSASIDLVVSFETIEHHDQHLEMMKEIRRVLRPEGVLIISSPDKHEYSDVPGYKNEYHIKELYLSEFTDLLASEFRHITVFGQRGYFGSLVAPLDGGATRFATYSRRDRSVRREPGVMKPLYYIALASNATLPEIHSGLYEGASYLESQFAARNAQITSLSQAVVDRDAQIVSLSHAVAERDGQIAGLSHAVAERDGQIAGLSHAVAERDGQIAGLSHAVAERDGQIASLNQAAAERDGQIARLNQAAAERDGQIASLNQAAAERDGQIARLNQAAAERDGQIARLNQAAAERDGQIARLNQAAAERDGQIASLNQAAAERDGQIASLNQAAAERDGQIASLNQAAAERDALLRAVRTSTSWRITALLRAPKEIAHKVSGGESREFLRNAVGATKSEVRRRGSIGVLLRVPHYIRHRQYYAKLVANLPGPDPRSLTAAVARPARLHPDLSGVDSTIDHSVSVVIPTLNAGHEFPWLLRKLRAQQGLKPLEIVIVDSGSTDGTVEFAKAAGCKIVEIAQKDFTHSSSRNTGAAAAKGEFLLFMVQDAYPIGEYWAYGMLRYLLDHAVDRVAAVSCSEYSRSDSDIMYDSMINTHYRFLGCLEQDRIGEYRGDDHISLRSTGQLSDVSCLIPSELFGRYRYRGHYAEDLDLGIRLIKDGYRVAMLASVKVIHSHNRPAFYHLKRSFVDVVFLAGVFEDAPHLHVESAKGLIAGIVSTAAHLSRWLETFDGAQSPVVLHEELALLITGWRKEFMQPMLGQSSGLGDSNLDAYVDGFWERDLAVSPSLDRASERELQQFVEVFLARLEHFNTFARNVYLEQDASLRAELCVVVRKTFAAAVGSSLGYLYLEKRGSTSPEHTLVERIKTELASGI